MSAVNDEGHTEGQRIVKEGIQIAALIRKAAAIGAAIDNSLQLKDNYKKQRDISNRSLRISESELAHTASVYWPRELQFLAEFGTPEEVEAADVYGRRFAGHLIPKVAKAFAVRIKQLRCNANRWCTSAFARSMQALYQAQASAVTNIKIMGYCQGFAYAKAKTDTNDKRRLQALGIAKGLFNKAAGLYQSAAQVLANTGGDKLNGVLNALTSFRTAEETSRNSVYDLPPYEAKNPAMTGDYDTGVHFDSGAFGMPKDMQSINYELDDWMTQYKPEDTATSNWKSAIEDWDASVEGTAAWQRPGRQALGPGKFSYKALQGVTAMAGNIPVSWVGGSVDIGLGLESVYSYDPNDPVKDIKAK